MGGPARQPAGSAGTAGYLSEGHGPALAGPLQPNAEEGLDAGVSSDDPLDAGFNPALSPGPGQDSGGLLASQPAGSGSLAGSAFQSRHVSEPAKGDAGHPFRYTPDG